MLITFLVVIFSNLSFANLSIQELLNWYNYHPFLAILAIQDIILGSLILFRLFNELTVTEQEMHLEDSCCHEDALPEIIYTNDRN